MAVAGHDVVTYNPASGEQLRSYALHSDREIDTALERAAATFTRRRTISFSERAAGLRRVAAHLRTQKNALAAIMTTEVGKPIVEAEAEIEKCAFCCEHFAEHGERYLADQVLESNATHSYVAFRPLGVLLAVMPWNFPFWQVFRAAAPALMAGNVLVLKHAANVTGCALAIAEIFEACDLPGVFTTLVLEPARVNAVVADARIAAVTLTGSEAAGSAVAAAAGKHLKKTVLELGGSDAFIVLGDADIAAAAGVGVRARFQNAGQSCIAAKRFIVVAAVYDRFLEAFAENARQLVVGDPFDRATQMGPLARADLREGLERQVSETLARGATAVLGAHRLERPGFYYAPTIVAGVVPGMPMFDEETFGPAAAISRARDETHAIELANASPFGLGGNLWTQDLSRAEYLAGRLESGAVFINGMTASDPRLPFGGVKRSGYGRELAAFGIQEFVNIQTVWIGPAR